MAAKILIFSKFILARSLFHCRIKLYFRIMRNSSIVGLRIFSFFAVVFLTLSFAINQRQHLSEDEIFDSLQNSVFDFSDEISTALNAYAGILKEKGIAEFEKQVLEFPGEGAENLSFFLYKEHNLVFWTNNKLLIPSSDSLITNERINCQKIGPHWLIMQTKAFDNYTLLVAKILHVDYALQNEFLRDQYLDYYGVPTDLIFSTDKKAYKITDQEGNFMLSFEFNQNGQPLGKMPYLLFFVFLLSFVFFALSVDAGLKVFEKTKSSLKRNMVFIVFTGFYLLFFYWIHFPGTLYKSPLFQSQLYSNLTVYSALGEIFLVSIWLLTSILFFIYYNKLNPLHLKSALIRFFSTAFVFLLLFGAYYGIYRLLISFVLDSQINLDITAITKLNFFSYTVLALVMMLQLSWFFLSKKLIFFLIESLKNKFIFFFLVFVFSLAFGFLPNQQAPINQFNQLFLFLYFISLFYLYTRQFKNAFWQNVYFLILFISISGAYYNDLTNQKEELVRKAGLSTYLLKNDPLLENQFLTQKSKIISDTLLLSQIQNGNFSNDSLIELIKEKYFIVAAKNYEISMVFCDKESRLFLMPQELETPCYPFFDERIKQAASVIEENSLYLVDQHFRTKNYIGIIEFSTSNQSKTKLFVEFLSKYQPKELGIPAMLTEAKNWDLTFFSNYSYAYYYNDELSEWFGDYDYKQNLESYLPNIVADNAYFSFENYSHYIYVQNDNNVLIVSKPEISGLKKLASLAFLFLFYSLNIGGVFLLIFLSRDLSQINLGFQSRLQISMVAILLFSFFSIGLASLYYLYYLNNEKNKNVLMEKSHSVLIELEHKIKNIDDESENNYAYLGNLLLKFSQVFFTDITLYDLNGKLIASSRPQLFDSELLSRRIDPTAFYNLDILKSSSFLQIEHIGLQEFYSVYIPFRSTDNKTMAYLNLPSFAKQNELEKEISGFLVAYLNIYMFLILLTLALGLLISNYLSIPLKLLKEKIQRLRLEAPNEKIEWKKQDEIGALILEYNRMVDELEESAEKLARSQRESAWREMAQQIAHEIKNPLTPMKLNIQYLEKAWKEGGDDFDSKLSRISSNIIEQIDSLSEIASQFSNFAAIDQGKNEIIAVKQVLTSSIDLFSGHHQIHFETNFPAEEIFLYADRNQFLRILNNLLKNAIQSIAENKNGVIKIALLNSIESFEIHIEDNGCGIAETEKPHIFEPRFTTKSGGMGLGLALVKKMVENAKGSIHFVSDEESGTRFVILFPKYKKV